MSWRYQVVKYQIPNGYGGGVELYAIHEAYLFSDKTTIRSITVEPVPVRGESVTDLETQLQRMREDLKEFGVTDYETVGLKERAEYHVHVLVLLQAWSEIFEWTEHLPDCAAGILEKEQSCRCGLDECYQRGHEAFEALEKYGGRNKA